VLAGVNVATALIARSVATIQIRSPRSVWLIPDKFIPSAINAHVRLRPA
jgi:hypothetical protein